VFQAFVPLLLIALLLASDLLVCPARFAFGIPCPGCGLTRATLALLHGDLAEAHHLHPLVLVLLPIVLWMLVRTSLVSSGLLARDSFDPLDKLPTWFYWVLLVVFVGVWVARLAGGLGGHPDAVDPANGFIGRVVRGVLGLSS
jgi:hypothetical protein